MDDNSNDNNPSRTLPTPANPWGNQFGYRDWRGGIHHEWHANGVGVLNPDQIRAILQSDQVQWTDYTSVKKNIVFTQMEIYNLEASKEHFERYISYDEEYIGRVQTELDKDIELLIRWRIGKILSDIFNSTCIQCISCKHGI